MRWLRLLLRLPFLAVHAVLLLPVVVVVLA